jgi:hypothetical protein
VVPNCECKRRKSIFNTPPPIQPSKKKKNKKNLLHLPASRTSRYRGSTCKKKSGQRMFVKWKLHPQNHEGKKKSEEYTPINGRRMPSPANNLWGEILLRSDKRICPSLPHTHPGIDISNSRRLGRGETKRGSIPRFLGCRNLPEQKSKTHPESR